MASNKHQPEPVLWGRRESPPFNCEPQLTRSSPHIWRHGLVRLPISNHAFSSPFYRPKLGKKERAGAALKNDANEFE